jgi:membrane peptidoglycan carboxypeptidase
MYRLTRRRGLWLVAILLFTVALLGGGYWAALGGLPRLDHPLAAAGKSILITDRHGAPLYEIIDPNGSKQAPVPLAEIPLACQQATIATEDSHFYQHPGVDPVAIVRAVWLNWREGRTVSGGSTLTQQLARTLYLTQDERNERSLRRKLREAWLAWRLERAYSKNDILTLYLNTAYYGHFAVGIESAAQAYFGVHARELDLAQCALLAGLPQYPAGYNPIENPAAAANRQTVVLDLMAKQGYISAAQAQEARKERLAYTSTPFPIEAPHFVMWVQGQLERILTPTQWRAGGLRITTTLDLDWQRQAESIVKRRLAQLRPCTGDTGPLCDPDASPARRVDDAALVALDPQTGAVRAMVGSADYFNPAIDGAVNATLSLRQPGSAIKPLTYAAALDPARASAAGGRPWTPATLIADVRTVFPTREGKPYVPQNYDMRYHGPVSVRMALANSYNIPAVKTLQHIGVDALIEQAAALGVNWGAGFSLPGADPSALTPAGAADTQSILTPQSFGLALTLGGGEVRLLDLTAAYAAFANGGQRVTPYAIEKIETLDGKTIADCGLRIADCQNATEDSADPQSAIRNPQSVDPRVAYLITNILSDNDARLPAFGPGNLLEIGRPAAAKTGTTTDWRDNWTLGYTPDLVTGVWAGNPDNTPMLDINGITGAGPIWHDFMWTVLRDAPVQDFPRPAGLVQVEICADSGLLPGASASIGAPRRVSTAPVVVPCPNRRLEWFIAGTEPQQVDRDHWQIAVDARTGGPVTPSTPAEAVTTQTIWALPGEYQAWARENDVPQLATTQSVRTAASGGGGDGQEIAATKTTAAGAVASEMTLHLASPDPNRAYRLDPGLPAAAQQLPVTVEPGAALAEDAAGAITVLLDGKPLAAASAPDYTVWWPLTIGEHTFQAVARLKNGAEARSEVVAIIVEQ